MKFEFNTSEISQGLTVYKPPTETSDAVTIEYAGDGIVAASNGYTAKLSFGTYSADRTLTIPDTDYFIGSVNGATPSNNDGNVNVGLQSILDITGNNTATASGELNLGVVDGLNIQVTEGDFSLESQNSTIIANGDLLIKSDSTIMDCNWKVYANNAVAISNGVPLNGLYITADGTLKVRY